MTDEDLIRKAALEYALEHCAQREELAVSAIIEEARQFFDFLRGEKAATVERGARAFQRMMGGPPAKKKRPARKRK